MKRLPASLLLLAVIAAAGCRGYGVQDTAETLWPGLNDPYIETTLNWTRHAELTDGIDVLVKASATLKSREWREAFAARYAQVYALTDEERAKLVDDQMRAHGENLDIVLAISGSSPELTNLKFRDPLWRVFASSSGKRVYLSEIRPMESNDWPPQKLKAFFPYYKRWRKFYTLSFPRPANGPVTLTVSGPAGEMRFTWADMDGDLN